VDQLIFIHIKNCIFVILQEHERESKHGQSGPWGMLVTHLPQVAVAERSYGDIGFLLTKNKGFLRKDVSQMQGVLGRNAQMEGDDKSIHFE
jgi:hypothetical protein